MPPYLLKEVLKGVKKTNENTKRDTSKFNDAGLRNFLATFGMGGTPCHNRLKGTSRILKKLVCNGYIRVAKKRTAVLTLISGRSTGGLETGERRLNP